MSLKVFKGVPWFMVMIRGLFLLKRTENIFFLPLKRIKRIRAIRTDEKKAQWKPQNVMLVMTSMWLVSDWSLHNSPFSFAKGMSVKWLRKLDEKKTRIYSVYSK